MANESVDAGDHHCGGNDGHGERHEGNGEVIDGLGPPPGWIGIRSIRNDDDDEDADQGEHEQRKQKLEERADERGKAESGVQVR